MKHKAISIRQPWAWLIAHGHKDIENRTWWTNYRGPILIHASLHMPIDDYHDAAYLSAQQGIELPARDKLEIGGVVGIARIRGCHIYDKTHPTCTSLWFFGPYGFALTDARPLPFFRCRGQLKIFDIDIPEEVLHGTP